MNKFISAVRTKERRVDRILGAGNQNGRKKYFERLPSHTNDVPATISGCSPIADCKWLNLKYCDLCAGSNPVLKHKIVMKSCRKLD